MLSVTAGSSVPIIAPPYPTKMLREHAATIVTLARELLTGCHLPARARMVLLGMASSVNAERRTSISVEDVSKFAAVPDARKDIDRLVRCGWLVRIEGGYEVRSSGGPWPGARHPARDS